MPSKPLPTKAMKPPPARKIATRIATWPEGFIVAKVDGVVAGFINSGAAFEVEMSDEAFKELIGHDPAGPHVVIMSVVVHPDYQGQGLAKRLMGEFIQRMRAMNKASIHLMCKERHIALYAGFGFCLHQAFGVRPWRDGVARDGVDAVMWERACSRRGSVSRY